MTAEIQRVGYWQQNRDTESDLPHPNDFVDESWDADERAVVIDLLNMSTMRTAWMGVSYCRMCRPDHTSSGRGGSHMGSTCQTFDGSWVFPAGYVHYIEEHGVKPPQAFLDHLLSLPDGLVAELRRHTEAIPAIIAKWAPYNKGEGCPDKDTACTFTVKDPDSIHCLKQMGGGSSGSYECLWAAGNRSVELKAEWGRHRIALEPFCETPWETVWDHR